MKTKNKTLLVLIGLLLCAAAIGGVMHWRSSAVEVETAVVKIDGIHEFVDERAKTRLPETHLITMPAAGRIEAVTLSEGDSVGKGDEVARIVSTDLELALRRATAVAEQLKARIAENDDVDLEQIVRRQAEHYKTSMEEAVKAAEARVTAGKAKLDYAESDLGRTQQLAERGSRTQDELEQAKLRHVETSVDYQQDRFVHAAMVAMQAATNLLPDMVDQYVRHKTVFTKAVLQKQQAEAQARREQVEQDSQRGTMHSPVDGVVLKRHITNERYLAAGDPLLEIGRMEDLEIEADVLSLDVVGAKQGDPVRIYGPAIGTPEAKGAVARVYPAGFTKVSSLGVEQQRVKVIVHFDAEDLARLRGERDLGVGYRVRVQITTAEKPEALVVPRSALFRGADAKWRVYAVRNGRATIAPVEIGLLNDRLAEIVEGLSEGDRVILAPESGLEAGMRVKGKDEG